jgi:ribonuclease Z
MKLILRFCTAAILIASFQPVFAQPSAQDGATGIPGKFIVTLLGTGGGPPVRLRRFGPSTLIQAGDQKLLFDCGRGVLFRLTQAGVPLESITRVFLTHLHSDHIVGIPDLLLTPWASSARKSNLEFWGPAGTSTMMNGLQQAFAFDIHIRRDVDERFPAEGIRVLSHDVHEGIVYEHGGVKVKAFLVDHGPVKPALGYRIEYGGYSVVLSGDTRYSENLIQNSKGTDLLIHEASDPDAIRAHLDSEKLERIRAHHITAEQLGKLFVTVKPRLAVLYHTSGDYNLLSKLRNEYSGPVEMGEDLMTIEIAEKINLHQTTPTWQ